MRREVCNPNGANGPSAARRFGSLVQLIKQRLVQLFRRAKSMTRNDGDIFPAISPSIHLGQRSILLDGDMQLFFLQMRGGVMEAPNVLAGGGVRSAVEKLRRHDVKV